MLEVRNIGCQRGYERIFQNLSFALNPGDILHLKGKNGSGKTSLLKIILGLQPPHSGTVVFDAKSGENTEARMFYLGHENAQSPALSVIENLDFFCALNHIETARENLVDALTKIGLAGFERFSIFHLSHGQKKRAALAALFLTNAEIWLLDEPFTALDKDAQKVVEQCIVRHAESGGMCIFSSHQNFSLRDCPTFAL